MKSVTTELMNKVHGIASGIDVEFSHVNSGGCGVVAGLLAAALSKYTDVDIVVCNNYGSRNLAELRSNANGDIEDWYDNGFSVTHVWVEFEFLGIRYAVDSTGVQTCKSIYADWGTPLKGALTVDEMKDLNAADHWNSWFSRGQIPDMEQYVSDSFDNLEVAA